MNQKEDDREISAKLRELRRARGLTVDTLAKKMGENSQKVGRIERGTRSLTFDYLVKVSKVLDTPVESFLGETKKPETPDSNYSILNEIVVAVENHFQKSLEPNKKGLMISKIYELSLKFPKESQKTFLDSLFEMMTVL